MKSYSIKKCEHLRYSLRKDFDYIKSSWTDQVHWTLPYRERFLTGSKQQGPRNNQHILDPTHVVALRSYVAGFLEGNTSTSRPWFKMSHPDPLMVRVPRAKAWISHLTERMLAIASSSNLYHALAEAYYDYGVVNTAVIWIDETENGPHFSVLPPGSYYLLNDARARANVLVREFQLSVKALVEEYALPDFSNLSKRVKELYNRSEYNEMIDICVVVKQNDLFNPDQPEVKMNRKWIQLTYEKTDVNSTNSYMVDPFSGPGYQNPDGSDRFLRIGAFTRKPFIAFRSTTMNNFAYGEWGPTTVAMGLIRSANTKVKHKDMALEQMVKPTTQGPASLKKQYITTSPGMHIPLDPMSMREGGAKRVFEISPAIAALVSDTDSIHSQIGRIYYQDFLLYLTSNPKTRTAAEVNAVQMEQQLVIGPNLQSLNWTLNRPLVEYLAEYAIFEDPYLESPPQELAGESIDPVFISIFAQAQKSADLPTIDRFVNMVATLAPTDAKILDKLDTDVLADLYEDRLYLPPGLNRSKGDVDALREKRDAEIQQQQKITEMLPAMAGAAKDLNLTNGG